jgi:hypothetical protein
MTRLFNFNNVLGQFVFVIFIIIAAHFHILAGVLAVLLVISMNQYVIEGMENNDDSSKEYKEESPISMFKTNNCKDGILMKDGKEITSDLIKTSFPDIKFSGDTCNPCDQECQFEIVSSVEQLTNEENLRPQDSNAHPIDREQVTKNNNST